MFTNKIASYYSPGKVLIEAACLSTDTKPTTGVANGSKCIEMDTGKKYMFNEEDSEWEELPSSGGGGGATVEALSVTQNGTYTAPPGKAYSPVNVNVAGGGGSSDFSTARVTFNNSARAQFLLPVARDDGDESASIPRIDAFSGIGDVILYKGMAFGLISDEGVNVTTTGAVEYDEGLLIITGDGTITIS